MGSSQDSRNGAGRNDTGQFLAAKTPRIAIVSDIHGNYEALKALPNDYDELWVLGDLVNYGPQPAEVIEFTRKRATLVVRGNHDDAVAFDRDPQCSTAFRRAAEETRRYTGSVLSEKHKGYLADLPHYRWVRRGRWTFYLCHAVPSNPLHAYCGKDIRKWRKELSVAGTDFLFVGHTHLQFSLREGEHSVVNPGSIGQPKTGTPRAGYAIWENGSVTLHNYEYLVEKTAARIRSMPVSAPTQEFLVKVLQSGAVPKSEKEAKHVKNYSA
ncbi:MAG: metallophosphoesterase family protein [Candidatus Acidiferrum sp.]